MNKITLASLPFMALSVSLLPNVSNADNVDFGTKVEYLLTAKSAKYFGVKKPLIESVPELEKIDDKYIAYRTPNQAATK